MAVLDELFLLEIDVPNLIFFRPQAYNFPVIDHADRIDKIFEVNIVNEL
jgi:hypothetical protein